MTVNIVELTELITQEGLQAKKLEELIQKAENEAFRTKLEKLKALSVQKLNLLVVIIKDGPWGAWK